MKRLLCFLIALTGALAVGATPMVKRGVNYDLVGWHTLEMSSDRITASGGAPVVTSDDGKLRLSAATVVLTMAKANGRQTISTAEAVGGVKLHAVAGLGQEVDAVCEKAVIRPSLQRVDLTGKVTVRKSDKTSGPAQLSGGTVTLYLKDGRIVATSPSAKDRLRVSPDSREKR